MRATDGGRRTAVRAELRARACSSPISVTRSPRWAVWAAALALMTAPAFAQTVETGGGAAVLLPEGALNGVGVLDAQGDTLRAGPRLIQVVGGAVTIPALDPANVDVFDPAIAVDARAFSIDARGQTVVVGLAFNDVTADADEPPQTAVGFAVARDGGATYVSRGAALDESRDTTVTYGVSTLPAIPATVPALAAPLDLALTAGADTIYSANQFAGLRRSTDGGATWAPVVLPPDSLLSLDPTQTYDFVYSPDIRQPLGFIDGDPERPVFPQFSQNFVAFSVLVDEVGTVWAGTAGGLNRSVRVEGADDPGWVRYIDAPVGGALPGNLVYALEARPLDGRDEVWAACWPSGIGEDGEEEFGVAVWRGDDDEGRALFETVLLGVEVRDLAFGDGRAYAASLDGLHVSSDDGATWRVLRTFLQADGRPVPLATPATLAVATTPGTVWVGTPGGLLRSTDGARTWTLFQANVRPGASGEGDRTVEVYAYPNPFNPGRDRQQRFRLDLDGTADVTIRIYDVAMNLVRTIEAPGRPAGPNEIPWDGQSDNGLRLANGAYVYTVEAGSRRLSGRILLVQ